ncbi:conserved hypothetical protein [Beutenbergia cavernae DSM 12333]|uniref:Uncharacterized protein n=1 Tax=Beutenbergia cavernae (strain ATCC BAA-8 / DSM 12333 / CCUG 43141 / JCM 11478 / NBRC 16432 / NCIMB 13614 / HKI 0122) TaxID=471853 RepID=C5C535_BEUC1|nr:hypothetical protein [Beutenbergia cavernae]ACQ82175.1 conserved hypothetical protein [Beutenbergia cavernae DSM 12333]
MTNWDRAGAREAKHEAAARIGELLARHGTAAAPRLGGVPTEPAGPRSVGVALGLAPRADGSFALAVRPRLGTPTARMVARRITDELGAEGVDVRRTGRIRPLRTATSGMRWPVPQAQATGETGRVRPLRPGLSIAHVDVTAGTLGAFVTYDGARHVLSNHHVLVGSSGQPGDAVLQPGPFDGGSDPADRIGALAHLVPLVAGEEAEVDAALASLDAPDDVDPAYPGGTLTGTSEVEGGEGVEKIGRTTGVTRGRVTAIEVDDLLVDYGEGLGTLSFSGQIEVEGEGEESFSDGGDSGSLVYLRSGMAAVGLLFAGSTTGGSNGQGLTYLNPIDTVLERLGAELEIPEEGT